MMTSTTPIPASLSGILNPQTEPDTAINLNAIYKVRYKMTREDPDIWDRVVDLYRPLTV